jgi:hypothetical protein
MDASASGFGQAIASAGGGGMPGMIGDFIGPYALQLVPIRIDVVGGGTFYASSVEGLPILSRGPYKIAENESPQPQDRVFATFNYFRIEGSYPRPSPSISAIDLYRETVGFEKTFLNGHASIGLRVPFFQSYYQGRTLVFPDFVQNYDNTFINLDTAEIGDTSLILKFALGSCRYAKLCSFGLVLTIPTGPDTTAYDPFTGLEEDIHSGIAQPWFGYLYTMGGWYIQGFHSVAIPLHTGDDVVVMFNDIGVGYYLYGDPTCCAGDMYYDGALITSIVPTLELHLNTPLTNGGEFEYLNTGAAVFYVPSDEANVLMDQSLVLTAGVHFGLMGASTLTVATAVPLTDQAFDIEAIVQFNCRF